MVSRRASLVSGVCVLLASCGLQSGEPASGVHRTAVTKGQSITYVGKKTTTNFIGLGQHLQYWPLFGRTSGATARRTDDDECIELTPSFASFKHHYLLEGRTFSNDALGSPIGTKTRGGYPTWPIFTLPDGSKGRSGTFYDESNIDNKNNTVNQMRINVGGLHEFCLNLITDNTNHEHDPNVLLEARSDDVNLSLAGHPDLTFDGQTDMYTFRYEGMEEDDVIKIRMQCSSASGCKGAGLGGIMVSDISTCAAADPDAGRSGSDSGAPPALNDAGTDGAREAARSDAGSESHEQDAGERDDDPPRADAEVGCACTIEGGRGGAREALGYALLIAALVRRRIRASDRERSPGRAMRGGKS